MSAQTPYQLLGQEGIRLLADTFYEVMDELPEAATIRAMHADNVVKTAGLAVVAIGWFLTSESARDYLMEHPAARAVSLVAVIIVATVHILGIWNLWLSSRRLGESIDPDSQFVHPEVVRMYEVRTAVAVFSTLLAAGLFGALFVLVADL